MCPISGGRDAHRGQIRAREGGGDQSQRRRMAHRADTPGIHGDAGGGGDDDDDGGHDADGVPRQRGYRSPSHVRVPHAANSRNLAALHLQA